MKIGICDICGRIQSTTERNLGFLCDRIVTLATLGHIENEDYSLRQIERIKHICFFCGNNIDKMIRKHDTMLYKDISEYIHENRKTTEFNDFSIIVGDNSKEIKNEQKY